jgi:uncharacterized linocin/CFP29 family protein
MKNAIVQPASKFLGNRSGGINNMRPYIGKDGRAYVMNHTGGDPKKPENYQAVPVNNAVLRYDEWRALDDAVVRVAEDRLVGYEDLRSKGLVRPLGNAMGTTVLTWEEMSDAMEANVSIDPVKRGNNDQVDFSTSHIPIPVIYADYSISERILQESRNRGNGVDTMNAERAARKVAEKLENMLFGATATLSYGGGTIHSYVSHPDVNDVALATAWTDGAMTPALILADILAMKSALIADGYYGPYMIYIPTAYETVLDEDYTTSNSNTKTIRQRILDISSVEDIKVVDKLPADNVLMVTLNSDVVDIIDGLPMQNVQWDTEGGMVHNYKVMTIQVPRVKSDYNGASGIALLA